MSAEAAQFVAETELAPAQAALHTNQHTCMGRRQPPAAASASPGGSLEMATLMPVPDPLSQERWGRANRR